MIGSGAFSTVHRAKHLSSGELVALKVIEKKAYKKCSSLLEKEITVMHLLDDHKHIVKLREVLTTPFEVQAPYYYYYYYYYLLLLPLSYYNCCYLRRSILLLLSLLLFILGCGCDGLMRWRELGGGDE